MTITEKANTNVLDKRFFSNDIMRKVRRMIDRIESPVCFNTYIDWVDGEARVTLTTDEYSDVIETRFRKLVSSYK